MDMKAVRNYTPEGEKLQLSPGPPFVLRVASLRLFRYGGLLLEGSLDEEGIGRGKGHKDRVGNAKSRRSRSVADIDSSSSAFRREKETPWLYVITTRQTLLDDYFDGTSILNLIKVT